MAVAKEYNPHADIPYPDGTPPPSYRRKPQRRQQPQKNPGLDTEQHSHWQIDVESKEVVSLDDTRITRAIKVCGL
jgi:hypothetical protein